MPVGRHVVGVVREGREAIDESRVWRSRYGTLSLFLTYVSSLEEGHTGVMGQADER